MIIETL